MLARIFWLLNINAANPKKPPINIPWTIELITQTFSGCILYSFKIFVPFFEF